MERTRSFGIRRDRPVRRGTTLAAGGSDEPLLRELLGLPVADHDPVAIITAAQVRLRRWRRLLNGDAADTGHNRAAAAAARIRRITQARDVLLRRVVVPDEHRVCN